MSTITLVRNGYRSVVIMHTSLTDSSPEKCLIPKPDHIEMQPGHFTITPATKVLYSGDDERVADAAAHLASRLSKAFDRKVTSRPAGSDKGRPNTIVLTTDQADAELGEEGYALTVSEDSVVNGCVWGTWLKSFPHLLYMTYPRACALSEVAWSEDTDRRYDAFHDRLLLHLKRLDAAGVKYRMPTDIDKPSVTSYKSGNGVVHYRNEAK